jgi:hypothetical protein
MKIEKSIKEQQTTCSQEDNNNLYRIAKIIGANNTKSKLIQNR